MKSRYGFISVDDHAQEHPQVWTQRLSQSKWGERNPHLERQADGTEYWVVDGQKLPLPGVALVGAVMADRAQEPQRWADVPKMAYDPHERLTTMDVGFVSSAMFAARASSRRRPQARSPGGPPIFRRRE